VSNAAGWAAGLIRQDGQRRGGLWQTKTSTLIVHAARFGKTGCCDFDRRFLVAAGPSSKPSDWPAQLSSARQVAGRHNLQQIVEQLPAVRWWFKSRQFSCQEHSLAGNYSNSFIVCAILLNRSFTCANTVQLANVPSPLRCPAALPVKISIPSSIFATGQM
jgi:hypothetical protein